MKLLMDLYRISSPSGMEKEMIDFITAWLRRAGISYTVDGNGSIYATKGVSDTYPCVVAHTDEVHRKRDRHYEVVLFRDEIIFGYDKKRRCFKGIGADDKNGIWVCLKCLEVFDHIKCVFFTGEETGCIGSGNADMAFFEDCRFVLQCDRRGKSDLVTKADGTDLCSEEFIRAVNPTAHGYHTAAGMQTDVQALKRKGLGMSCVNISCGYYNPHSDEEFTDIRELDHCYRFVRSIIRECTAVYPHAYSPPAYPDYGAYFGYGWSSRGSRAYPADSLECDGCANCISCEGCPEMKARAEREDERL